MEAWMTTFTEHVKLRDLRLVKRLEKIIRTLVKRPNLTIPEAFCSHSEITATYRFFDNEKVTASAIRDGFCAATVEKIKDEKIVLIATDLTGINYSSHKKLGGLGPMKNWQSRGLALVSSLAINTKGTPQGLIPIASKNPNKLPNFLNTNL